MQEVDDLLLKKSIECYELMDQRNLLELKQAYERDLAPNTDTEQSVVFVAVRIQLIDLILEEQEEKFKTVLNVPIQSAMSDRIIAPFKKEE